MSSAPRPTLDDLVAQNDRAGALLAAGNVEQAVAAYQSIVRACPGVAEVRVNLGIALAQLKRHAEALAELDRAIGLKGELADAHFNRGNVLVACGRGAEAEAAYLRSIQLQPRNADAWVNLGNLYKANRQLDRAIAAYRRAAAAQPAFAPAHYNLGNALRAAGRPSEAVAAYDEALRLRPDYADAANNRGNALNEQARHGEAVESYQLALRLRPEYAEAIFNMANALHDAGKPDEAATQYRRAIALKEDYPGAWVNLGNVLKDQGRLDEALAAFAHARALEPGGPAEHNYLYTLQYHAAATSEQILAEHRQWYERVSRRIPALNRWDNDADPDRILRVGYVAPDFRDHCQSFFTVPLLSSHARDRVRVYCYSDVAKPDAITRRLQGYADVWHDVSEMTDEELTRLVQFDRIDILVDLTLHMAKNRLLAFARRPAPVQITWLGYPGTTGLSAIDYRLTDPYLDPPGQHDDWYTETSIRLPHSFWCYDPLTDRPAVNDLPALSTGHVTFGCLNNFCKVNDGVLQLWARVLGAVPGSRLLVLADPGSHCQRVHGRFAQLGIAAERVEFIAKCRRAEYLKLYHRIDIGLDTVPYNGHTTSLDSLWMGVPVVTLVGQTVVGRAGLSQLSNVGLPELVAYSHEEYVEVATGLASDLGRLADLRRGLRARMQRSPLMDAPAFARGIEAAYRTVWRRWCGA
jgi:predicted O-linked N-acetylglucosamine transferase (SPINDLY family)